MWLLIHHCHSCYHIPHTSNKLSPPCYPCNTLPPAHRSHVISPSSPCCTIDTQFFWFPRHCAKCRVQKWGSTSRGSNWRISGSRRRREGGSGVWFIASIASCLGSSINHSESSELMVVHSFIRSFVCVVCVVRVVRWWGMSGLCEGWVVYAAARIIVTYCYFLLPLLLSPCTKVTEFSVDGGK